jgi:hypothetical protein
MDGGFLFFFFFLVFLFLFFPFSASSPGCVWWYEKSSRPSDLIGPLDVKGRVLCGQGMLDFVAKDGKDPLCKKAYLLHHRYALPGKDIFLINLRFFEKFD